MNERDLQDHQEQYGEEEEDMQEQEGDRIEWIKKVHVPVYDTNDRIELARKHLHQDIKNAIGKQEGESMNIHADADAIIDYVKAKI